MKKLIRFLLSFVYCKQRKSNSDHRDQVNGLDWGCVGDPWVKK